jgi:hypothetical protein
MVWCSIQVLWSHENSIPNDGIVGSLRAMMGKSILGGALFKDSENFLIYPELLSDSPAQLE